jgi:hypothetical protein
MSSQQRCSSSGARAPGEGDLAAKHVQGLGHAVAQPQHLGDECGTGRLHDPGGALRLAQRSHGAATQHNLRGAVAWQGEQPWDAVARLGRPLLQQHKLLALLPSAGRGHLPVAAAACHLLLHPTRMHRRLLLSGVRICAWAAPGRPLPGNGPMPIKPRSRTAQDPLQGWARTHQQHPEDGHRRVPPGQVGAPVAHDHQHDDQVGSAHLRARWWRRGGR